AISAGASAPRRSIVPLIPVAIGLLAVVTGGVLELAANGQYSALVVAQTHDAARVAASSGKSMETAGWVLVAIGSAAIIAGGATFFYSRATVTPTVALVPGGASFGLT